MLISIGGIHGNEPAGVYALQRVLKKLKELHPPINGDFIAITGNIGALTNKCRYLDTDLNRLWQPERITAMEEGYNQPSNSPEEQEQQELLSVFDTALRTRRGHAIFLDLHSTSADGAPFTLISDTLKNRLLAQTLQVPIILGLEENVDGTLLNYINELGHTAIGFEAGQNEAPSSIDNDEAVIWLMLVSTGIIAESDVPELSKYRHQLHQVTQSIPKFLELRYRQSINPSDQFEMLPGFKNFQPIKQGEHLANDYRGPVNAQEDGFIFMPLYQKLGSDGYFLIRGINPFWLKLSALMRRMGLDRLVRYLPGVSVAQDLPDTLIINKRIARWSLIEICHLLGFRRQTDETSEWLIINRRRQRTED